MRSSSKRGLSRAAFLLFSVLVTIVWTANASAQTTSEAKPNTLMVLVRSSAIPGIRHSFDSLRALVPRNRVNVQSLSWQDAGAITTTLDLPSGFTPRSLRPFIAQHSAALEDLRERMEPSLFSGANDARAIRAGGVPASFEELRASETRVARWFILTYNGDQAPASAARELSKSSLIELAEPEFIRKPCYTPNDPMFQSQYGPQLIKAPEAWDVVRCDSSMVIADVDVGTDWSHEDLAKSIFINQGEVGVDANGLDKRSNGIDDDSNGFVDDWHGWDFGGVDGSNPDNNTIAVAAHGTHTAGIMAATGDNGVGIAGVAFGARLLPIKGADDAENLDYIWPGVVYAADMGARAVNCSWGGPSRSQAEQDVVNYVTAKGLAVIAASGNSGLQQEFYPASYDNVLSVGAVDNTGSYVSFTNRSTRLAVLAPGLGVLSTIPGNNYQASNGTSMACPHGTASVAMVLQRFPALTVRQAIEQVRATCDSLTANPFPGFTGRGIIDLYRAVTDRKAYSVRIDSVEVFNLKGGNSLSAGDSGQISIHVRNWLTPLENLHARIEILADHDSAWSGTSDITFGSLGTLQSAASDSSKFGIHIGAESADATILVRVTFYDPVGYTDDIDYFRISVNPSYLNLAANNLTVTFDSKGSIGFADQQANTLGVGFYWTNPPANIAPNNRQVLYASGLMVGDDTQRVVSSAPGPVAGFNDQDFTSVSPIVDITGTEHSRAAQVLLSRYSDTLADSTAQVGVSVIEKSYAFRGDLAANAAVIDYTLRKHLTASGTLPNDSVAIALYADWDIGVSGANNYTYFDSSLNIAIARRLDPDYPIVGVILLSDLPRGASLNFYADQNDGMDGSIDTYNGLSRSQKWTMMTTNRSAAGPKDVSMVFGIVNAPLRSADSVSFTIATFLATNDSTLRLTADAIRRAWQTRETVSQDLNITNSFETFPNPLGDQLHVQWGAVAGSGTTTVTLFDMLGRVVRQADHVFGNSVVLPTSGLVPGGYLLEVQSGALRQTRLLISAGSH